MDNFRKLCDTLLALGEVITENENYTQAVEELSSCLKKHKEKLRKALYQIGVALGAVHVSKKGLPALKIRCEELLLQPRGTKGEPGGQNSITSDISNKLKLGLTVYYGSRTHMRP